MRTLFFSLPLRGHVNPTLPVVRELVDRGDEVIYYATERYAADVERAGARFRPYRDPLLTDLSQLPAQTDELSWRLMRTSASVLETELHAFRAERPDYVITDSVAPWGQWVGRILQRPVVTSISTFAFNRQVMAFAMKHGVRPRSARRFLSKLRHMSRAFRLHRRLCRQHRVDGPGVMASVMGHSDLNIVYTSRQFQPRADTFDERFQFVGPMLSRTGNATFPWEQLQSAVVVYVSLGTLFNDDADFYRRCFRAFGDEDFQVVMSTGTNVSRDSLGTPPPNFLLADYVPQLDLLQRVKAFVTHGGMNSVSESLSYAVPMVVIPQMGEQAVVGSQVEQLGAGLCLVQGRATVERLRESVRQLLANRRFREQAAVIRQSFQQAGGAARATEAIFAFTR